MERFKGLLFLGGGLLIGILLGIGALWGAGNMKSTDRLSPPTSGKQVPDFNLKTMDGKSVRLADLKGKPVVINFWATWCPPCKVEMPLLEQASRQFGDRVVFLAVDDDEDLNTVQSFARQAGVSFPVLLDPNGKINQLYFVQSYPNTFFIDSDGILRAQRIGQLDEAILGRNLEAVGIKP